MKKQYGPATPAEKKTAGPSGILRRSKRDNRFKKAEQHRQNVIARAEKNRNGD